MSADQEQDCRRTETLYTESIPVTIVMGSARSDGNTAQTVQAFLSSLALPARRVDLNTLRIHPFEYARPDREDDFRSVVEAMTATDDIVFATPVYWYAMSGTMKVLFDRLTDILGDPIGRKLAGRRVSVLVSGTEKALPPGFHEPCKQSRESGITSGSAWTGAPCGRGLENKLARMYAIECLRHVGVIWRASRPTHATLAFTPNLCNLAIDTRRCTDPI